ncbi:hypothetical protein ACQJBY_040369 [Aegilops geniculata]
MDLNMMPQEEDDEGINLNWIPEQEEPQVAENVAMDLNLMPQEEDDEAMNWMPPEDEGKEDGAQEQEDEVMNWILQEKRRELSDKERHGVYFALLVIELRDGSVQPDDKLLVSNLLDISVRSVERIWEKAKKQIADGKEVDVSSTKPGKSGRKRKELDLERTSTIPLNKRRTIRSLARSLGVARSTLHKRFQLNELNRITSTVKPHLKLENKLARLKFCMSMVDDSSISTSRAMFKPMTNMVHIDEKWFDMTRVKNSYYVLPGEPEPKRTVSNTHSIGKVMFLTAVAKPRYNNEGELTFDGKIGIWAFVEETEAKRTSQNRTKGTKVLTSVKVTRPVCRDYLINKVIPAIQDKWPDDDEGATIFIQQDNAKPHVLPNDAAFREAVEQTDLDIRLLQQPPNSPELNCLDLCFHNSLQSLTDCRSPTNIQELVQGVEEEFENYDPDKLHRSFITLEAVMFEVMKDKGGNQYKLPHLHKDRFQNAGMEITGVYCDSQVVVDTRVIIEEMEIAIGKENERKELAREGKRKKSKGKGREEVAKERI